MTPYDAAIAGGATHVTVACDMSCFKQEGFNEWMREHIQEPFMFALGSSGLYVNFINSQEAMLFKLRWTNAA